MKNRREILNEYLKARTIGAPLSNIRCTRLFADYQEWCASKAWPCPSVSPQSFRDHLTEVGVMVVAPSEHNWLICGRDLLPDESGPATVVLKPQELERLAFGRFLKNCTERDPEELCHIGKICVAYRRWRVAVEKEPPLWMTTRGVSIELKRLGIKVHPVTKHVLGVRVLLDTLDELCSQHRATGPAPATSSVASIVGASVAEYLEAASEEPSTVEVADDEDY